MKGNNGQAARKRMIRRFMVGGGICVSIGVLILVSDFLSSPSSNEGTSRQLLRSNDPVKNAAHTIQEKARKFRQDLHKQHTEQFNEAEMIDKILEAEIHLVSLGLNEEELERSHPSTYAGVYGNFCKLNFAAHKKDPAAGTLKSIFIISNIGTNERYYCPYVVTHQ